MRVWNGKWAVFVVPGVIKRLLCLFLSAQRWLAVCLGGQQSWPRVAGQPSCGAPLCLLGAACGGAILAAPVPWALGQGSGGQPGCPQCVPKAPPAGPRLGAAPPCEVGPRLWGVTGVCRSVSTHIDCYGFGPRAGEIILLTFLGKGPVSALSAE